MEIMAYLVVGQFGRIHASEAKAPTSFAEFMYGLKPVPFKLTTTISAVNLELMA